MLESLVAILSHVAFWVFWFGWDGPLCRCSKPSPIHQLFHRGYLLLARHSADDCNSMQNSNSGGRWLGNQSSRVCLRCLCTGAHPRKCHGIGNTTLKLTMILSYDPRRVHLHRLLYMRQTELPASNTVSLRAVIYNQCKFLQEDSYPCYSLPHITLYTCCAYCTGQPDLVRRVGHYRP